MMRERRFGRPAATILLVALLTALSLGPALAAPVTPTGDARSQVGCQGLAEVTFAPSQHRETGVMLFDFSVSAFDSTAHAANAFPALIEDALGGAMLRPFVMEQRFTPSLGDKSLAYAGIAAPGVSALGDHAAALAIHDGRYVQIWIAVAKGADPLPDLQRIGVARFGPAAQGSPAASIPTGEPPAVRTPTPVPDPLFLELPRESQLPAGFTQRGAKLVRPTAATPAIG